MRAHRPLPSRSLLRLLAICALAFALTALASGIATATASPVAHAASSHGHHRAHRAKRSRAAKRARMRARARREARLARHTSRVWQPAPTTTTTTTTAPTTTTTTTTTAPAPTPTTTTTDPAPAPTPTTTTDPAPAPAPTTTTAPSGSLQGWNGFGAGSWPTADWRPYADSSPFNQAVTGVAVHPNSTAIVSKVLSWGLPGNLIAGTAGTTSDYGHPTYYSQPTDPLYTLHATSTQNEIEGMQIPIPSAAQPALGGDGHMTVVTPDGWEYDFWRVSSKPAGGGTLTFAIGGRTRIDGDGLNGRATAANFGNLAGVIRAQELAAGHIDHALFIVLKCTSGTTDFGFNTQPTGPTGSAYVYPARHGGSTCASSEGVNVPPIGARFRLAMTDAQIAALAVPDWKKTIATALAHYGGYVGDTGGPGFGLQFESSTMYTSLGASDPLVDFAKTASGVSLWNGTYVFNLASGIDWAKYLQVVVPPAGS